MIGWGHGERVGVLFMYMLTLWLNLASIAWSVDATDLIPAGRDP
jgi:hypothetical protein